MGPGSSGITTGTQESTYQNYGQHECVKFNKDRDSQQRELRYLEDADGSIADKKRRMDIR